MRAAVPHENPAYKIGIVCFPTYGGSGVLATELALGLATRGHEVHLISSQPPVRFSREARLHFHLVKASDYPLFTHPPYTIALASKLAAICLDVGLDCLHAHYALPHAVAIYLAQQIVRQHNTNTPHQIPKLITTLHGTDVTHVGWAPENLLTLQLALGACDSLTTPSQFLKEEAFQRLTLSPALTIDVIPNFIDTKRFQPRPQAPPSAQTMTAPQSTSPTLLHISNYRPVKRVLDIIEIYAKVRATHDAQLIMIGDGPDRPAAEQRAQTLGISDGVTFYGNQVDTVFHLQQSQVLLLPSEMESFGLVALEALGCGVPVVATQVGGLPEVIRHGQTGFLAAVGDTDAMAAHVVTLLDNPTRAKEMGQQGRTDVLRKWERDHVLSQYEALYQRLLQTTNTP